MTIEIPVEALDDVNNSLSHITIHDDANGVFRVGHIRKLAAFANHFASRPLPGMQVEHLIGAESVIHITDDSFGRVDVVKVNGETFTPELPTAASMEIPNATELYRRMLAECAVRFREYERGHREKADNLMGFGNRSEVLDKAERNASIALRIEKLLEGLDEPAPELPADVRALVIAARIVWDDLSVDVTPSAKDRDALDKALEAFASRVPYGDEPEASGMVASNDGVTDFAVESGATSKIAAIGSAFNVKPGEKIDAWGIPVFAPVDAARAVRWPNELAFYRDDGKLLASHERPEAVKVEEVGSLDTEVTFEGKIRDRFEDRMRAQKIDAFAIAASEDDIANFLKWKDEGLELAGTREQARYDFAFAMMAERERRGLK